jgi:hypothetical protein
VGQKANNQRHKRRVPVLFVVMITVLASAKKKRMRIMMTRALTTAL